MAKLFVIGSCGEKLKIRINQLGNEKSSYLTTLFCDSEIVALASIQRIAIPGLLSALTVNGEASSLAARVAWLLVEPVPKPLVIVDGQR